MNPEHYQLLTTDLTAWNTDRLVTPDLSDAYLSGANLPAYQLPSGSLTVWKKIFGRLIRLRIPPTARRTACLINRKCRAEFAYVEWIEGGGPIESRGCLYRMNGWVYPDSYDDDPRVDCTHGIHFFATRKEAEEW